MNAELKQKYITFVKKWEGGFSNHPNDKGGPTMQGITLATFNDYRQKMGLPPATVDDLKKISTADWENVFNRLYWNPCKADLVKDTRNAICLVAWAWGSGVNTAIKLFQKNYPPLVVDGLIGAATIEVLGNAKFEDLCKIREKFYRDIVLKNPSQTVFLKGWLNRLEDFKKTFSDEKGI